MKTSDLLSLSTRMFKTRPMRTFLTVLGVGVGIGTVLFLVSLGYGLQNVILNRIATADSLLTFDIAEGPSEDLALTPEAVRQIQALPTVADVSTLKQFDGQMTANDLSTSGQVSVIDPAFLRLRGVTPVAGSMAIDARPRSLLISSAGVKLFNLTPEEAIGKKLSVVLSEKTSAEPGAPIHLMPQEPYTITGVFDDESQNVSYVMHASLSGATIDRYDQLKVKVASSAVMEETRNALIERGYVVSALSDTIDQANKIFRIVQIVLTLFGLVALVVSAIGMFNTMTITLLERTNEIGIMRAIGITRRDLRTLFLTEAMLMGFLGGMGGVLIGLAAGEIANLGVNMLARRFGGIALDLFYSPLWFIGVIIGFSTFIGFVTGIYPSFRASHLNPLDALRYK